jgi:hypothetical protein
VTFAGRVAQLRFLDLDAVEGEVVEVASVVEGTDADLSPGEGFIGGGFDGLFHVIEKDVDAPGFDIADDFEFVPLAVFPGDAIFALGDGCSRRVVDDEDLAGVGVGLFAEVDVVEFGGALVVEEEAEVAVAAGGLRGLDAGGELKGADEDVLAEGNAVWAAVGRVVVGLAEKFVDLVVVDGGEFPLVGVGGLPFGEVAGEVLGEEDWERFGAEVGREGEQEEGSEIHGVELRWELVESNKEDANSRASGDGEGLLD